jgi:hypothetical protein
MGSRRGLDVAPQAPADLVSAGPDCQSGPAEAIFGPGSVCWMPYKPEFGFSA